MMNRAEIKTYFTLKFGSVSKAKIQHLKDSFNAEPKILSESDRKLMHRYDNLK